MNCGVAQRHFLDAVRGSATDAVRLEIESHLEECAPCQRESARWKLVGLVKQQPAPRLSAGGERRILAHLVSAAVRPEAARREPMRRPWVWVTAGVSALVLLVAGGVSFVGSQRGVDTSPAVTAADTTTVIEGQVVKALEAGAVTFAGAKVNYRGGTRMSLHPGRRLVSLWSGEVDVDVKPGRPGRFRVITPRFIVEVVGTRFLVTPGRVLTMRGKVRILDSQNRELAVLSPGDSWDAPAAPAAALPPPLPAPTADVARMPAVAPRRDKPRELRKGPPADALARSRAALARGDAREARALAQGALAAIAANPTTTATVPGRQSADVPAFELLVADSLLVEKRPDDAIEGYRRVMRRNPRSSEAETAQFTIGQLLFERRAVGPATTALNDYLARYPVGRFVREAREDLVQLRSLK